MLAIETEQPPLQIQEDGTVRVGATRVTLDTVITAYHAGATAEQIVQEYSALHLADVYAVISYYLRHSSDVDEYLRQRNAQAEEMRRKIELSSDTQRIRQLLLARRDLSTSKKP